MKWQVNDPKVIYKVQKNKLLSRGVLVWLVDCLFLNG